MNNYPEIITNLIQHLKKLPGIGEKTAMRLTFHLLNSDENFVSSLGNLIINLKQKIKLCKICYNFTEKEICNICSNPNRDKTIICIVEDVNDMINIESTGKFNGLYHILHGVFSPISGITFENIKIKELFERVKNSKNLKEIIIATNPTAEGNATAVYIKDNIEKINKNIKITRIAVGIPQGAELEYIDKITLSKALENRLTFKN